MLRKVEMLKVSRLTVDQVKWHAGMDILYDAKESSGYVLCEIPKREHFPRPQEYAGERFRESSGGALVCSHRAGA